MRPPAFAKGSVSQPWNWAPRVTYQKPDQVLGSA